MLKLSEENIELKFEAEQARKDVPRLKVGIKLDEILFWPRCVKTCLQGLRTTKAKTSLCRLISTFVIRYLESIISKHATDEVQFSS